MRPPAPGVDDLLAETDVLIDGPYLEARNTGTGLRGSDNQRIHHLTPRLLYSGYDFENRDRGAEIRVRTEGEVTELMLVGVPPPHLLTVVEETVRPGTRHERGDDRG
jgi:anaerobic ribonucleoside-triphosphate reductase activating protein